MEEEEETEDIGMEYLIHPEKDEQPIKVWQLESLPFV